MENKLQAYKAPTIQELYKDVDAAIFNDELNTLLNQNPPATWVKEHPYVRGHKYIPIEKVEYLLKKIFKKYSIEILREGTSFNGVYVVVRVHYLNPISNEMEHHDGIGAIHLQVKSGSSPADLANINNGALSMAYPLAKTLAIKDACDHFGSLFGANLNRKDVLAYSPDEKLKSVQQQKEHDRLSKLIKAAKSMDDLEKLSDYITEDLQEDYQTKWNSLK